MARSKRARSRKTRAEKAADKAAAAAAAKAIFPFLELLSELCNTIYRFCLVTRTDEDFDLDEPRFRENYYFGAPQILRVCR